MRVVCVDDEKLVLDLTVSMVKSLPFVEDVQSFTDAREALAYFDENEADVALLDIDMPEMNGIAMAVELKSRCPDVSIVFLTGYSEYAVEAFAMHASGYLLKPIGKDRLTEELEHAMEVKRMENSVKEEAPEAASVHVEVKTFGNFDVMADGKIVVFNRSKAKELLAYLVDRQGGSVTRSEAFALLWEEGMYDRSMQKQLDVMIRSLKQTLESYGIGDILETQRGTLRLVPEKVDCDMYRMLNGDIKAINSYRGEYMSSYSWASLTEAYVTRSLED